MVIMFYRNICYAFKSKKASVGDFCLFRRNVIALQNQEVFQ